LSGLAQLISSTKYKQLRTKKHSLRVHLRRV